MYLNLFDLSDVVNITCMVHYGNEINIHTYKPNMESPAAQLDLTLSGSQT